MDRYLEKKRERRIRDFQRMVQRAYLVISLWRPEPNQDSCWCPRTWDELIKSRRRQARRFADNLRVCSCFACGNPRRHWGRTYKEIRQFVAANEQLIDEGFVDDSPGQRDGRRKAR